MKLKNSVFSLILIFTIMFYSCTEKPEIEEYPPVAKIEVSPIIGDTNTLFVADASASYDELNPYAVLQFQWNWGDNEEWSEYSTAKTATYKYDSVGSFIVGVRVIDSSGWTDVDYAEIMVIESD